MTTTRSTSRRRIGLVFATVGSMLAIGAGALGASSALAETVPPPPPGSLPGQPPVGVPGIPPPPALPVPGPAAPQPQPEPQTPTPVSPPSSMQAGASGDCTIVGTAGNDTLRGTVGRDVICGLGGNDRITGAGGRDVLRGGPGNDTFIAKDHAVDTIYGGPGTDRVTSKDAKDRLIGIDLPRVRHEQTLGSDNEISGICSSDGMLVFNFNVFTTRTGGDYVTRVIQLHWWNGTQWQLLTDSGYSPWQYVPESRGVLVPGTFAPVAYLPLNTHLSFDVWVYHYNAGRWERARAIHMTNRTPQETCVYQ